MSSKLLLCWVCFIFELPTFKRPLIKLSYHHFFVSRKIGIYINFGKKVFCNCFFVSKFGNGKPPK